MITAALRMFIELGMVQKFKIDYEVRAARPRRPRCVGGACVPDPDSSLPPPDAVQVAADRQKKLQNGPLPQLETCLQCVPVHVRDANGTNPPPVPRHSRAEALLLAIKGDAQISGALRRLYHR